MKINHLKWIILGLISGFVFPAFADDGFSYSGSRLNLTPGVTPISRDIYDLHMTIFYICVAIGIAVFAVIIYSLIKHRKSKGAVAAKFHGHTMIEIIWAVIPFLILVAMAVPATIVLYRMADDEKATVNIKITGYQWRWKYEYLDQGISFFSNLSTPQSQIQNKEKPGQWFLLEVDHPLVVPIHEKIRFLVTSNDVIHSWWVPDLGIKRDAIPGFIHEAWARIDKPGIYRGQCAELCGIGHAFMPIVIKAVTKGEFNQWVTEQQGGEKAASPPGKAAEPTAAKEPESKTFTKEELMKKGEDVYGKMCSVCHQPNGQGMPPTFPALKGGKLTTGSVVDHIKIVLNGKPGTAMQAFGEQLSDEDIAAVVTYERNSWGNNAGIVQPSEVAKLKGQSK